MNIVEQYLTLKAEYDAAREALRIAAYALKDLGRRLDSQPDAVTVTTIPTTDEVRAALDRRNQARAAMLEAWDVMPDNLRRNLISPR